jgi:hypothetical protein
VNFHRGPGQTRYEHYSVQLGAENQGMVTKRRHQSHKMQENSGMPGRARKDVFLQPEITEVANRGATHTHPSEGPENKTIAQSGSRGGRPELQPPTIGRPLVMHSGTPRSRELIVSHGQRGHSPGHNQMDRRRSKTQPREDGRRRYPQRHSH